jgi:hypothetical protein
MDPRLQTRLDRWHEAIQELARIEREFLTLEANEDPIWSSLFLESSGANVAEREARVFVNPIWREFSDGLVESKVQYNKAKRELDLKISAFQASYLQSKNESEAILKIPRSIT